MLNNNVTIFSRKIGKVILFGLAVQLYGLSLAFADGTQVAKTVASHAIGGDSGGGSGDTPLPDLFTGSMSYQIPVEVPPGRNGMEPGLALSYNSKADNGWVGMGWELGVGAIERSTQTGVDYTKNDFLLRRSGSSSELVAVTAQEYRQKIESDFINIRQVNMTSSFPSIYFVATNKTGVKFYFGQTENSCMYGPLGVFKWSLNKIEDLNGNLITFTYLRDNGQIYLDKIDYNGNQIKFYLDDRTDKPNMYTNGFLVQTAKRLKLIDVISPSGRLRSYKLSYSYSNSTSRSYLASLQQFGKDALVDSAGTISNEASASKLPARTFSITNINSKIDETQWTGTAPNWGEPGYTWVGDFNGDGRMDIATARSLAIWVKLSKVDANGNNYFEEQLWSPSTANWGLGEYTWVGDFNGDGRSDIATAYSNSIWVKLSKIDANGNNYFEEQLWSPSTANWGLPGFTWIGDFNGDGRSDIATAKNNAIWVKLSKVDLNGNNYFEEQLWSPYSLNWGPAEYMWIGDFNGDGRTDIATAKNNAIWVKLSKVDLNGNGYFEEQLWSAYTPNWGLAGYTRVGDFNGDGRTDIVTAINNAIWVKLSKVDLNGNNCFEEQLWSAYTPNWGLAEYTWVGDFNGDGRMDIATAKNNAIWVKRSIGSGFIEEVLSPNIAIWGSVSYTRIGDFDGDGKTDIVTANANGPSIWVEKSLSFSTDLLTQIDNGTGAVDNIQYTPSTYFKNTNLPFPVQVVTKIARSVDGTETDIAKISYEGGYFYKSDRDFRGFNHVTVKGPVGPSSEQMITETWFHQGNDTTVDVNIPNVSSGYLKGKAYRTRVTDNAFGYKYSESTISYIQDLNTTAPYYFNPPYQVDSYIYDGDSSYKQTKTIYAYDVYGNVNREDHYGDVSDISDDRTVVRTFLPNIVNWIVGLPATEDIYQGIGTTNKIAGKVYYYDDLSACSASPTNNQTPVYGKLTGVESYLSGGTNPVIRMAYDSFGNPLCQRDAKGNITSIAYDASNTFPITVTNPLGQQSVTQYYGVDGVLADTGLYGQVKSSTDPNGASTTVIYDIFGRKTKETLPDGTWASLSYNNFGTVGSQHVRTVNSAGLWKASFFDGLGRTIKEKSSGPDNKTIVVDTVYNSTGTVKQASLPYFDGLETSRNMTYVYDLLGRVTRADNPDATFSLACYNDGVTVTIDAKNHRKRKVQTALGRLVKVQEYLGSYNTCTTDESAITTGNIVNTPYATTNYQYDAPGNLLFLTDAKGNQTEMRYDTLGRKYYMKDPDMGVWGYTYDANGNLQTQTDAKWQIITFGYDELNRLKTKKNGASLVLTNTYDEVVFGYSNKGRLTRMTDLTGLTISNYDSVGRIVSSRRTVSGVSYPLFYYNYTNGRLDSIIYPGNETISYSYNGGNLASVGGYATYSGYNALGQPGMVTFGNGVATTYGYYDTTNNRLKTIATAKGGTPLLSLLYGYDNVGNISGISNILNNTRSQSFDYDELNRLTKSVNSVYGTRINSYDQIGNILTKDGISYGYGTKPHAVTSVNGGLVYLYDANGNVFSDSLRGTTYGYDYDNMPTSTGNTSFTYDGTGTRVKKSTPGSTTVYVDKMYECTNGVCAKYIFAGSTRLARNSNGIVHYYHPDHLGSTSIVTDAAGAVAEDITYYPFGTSRQDSGTVSLSHKFTGQEKDSETGLYNYNARLYDADFGRFLTPDSIVPDPTNPQSLNRYSYVLNNPVNLVDPSGHASCQPNTLCIEANGGSSNSSGPASNPGVGPGGEDYSLTGDQLAEGFKDFGHSIGKGFSEIGKGIKNLFGGGHHSAPPPPVGTNANQSAAGGYNSIGSVQNNPINRTDPSGLNGGARLGYRSLGGWGAIPPTYFMNDFDLKNNTALVHAQIWFDNGDNKGFFSGGGMFNVPGEVRRDNGHVKNDYVFVGPTYDANTMRKALSIVEPRWNNSNYHLTNRSCQDFICAVTKEYLNIGGKVTP